MDDFVRCHRRIEINPERFLDDEACPTGSLAETGITDALNGHVEFRWRDRQVENPIPRQTCRLLNGVDDRRKPLVRLLVRDRDVGEFPTKETVGGVGINLLARHGISNDRSEVLVRPRSASNAHNGVRRDVFVPDDSGESR